MFYIMKDKVKKKKKRCRCAVSQCLQRSYPVPPRIQRVFSNPKGTSQSVTH